MVLGCMLMEVNAGFSQFPTETLTGLVAFGIFARSLPQTPEFSFLINSTSGLELADSITGDGHKMLNVVGHVLSPLNLSN